MNPADWLAFALGVADGLGKAGHEVWAAFQGAKPELRATPWSDPAARAALDARTKRLAELDAREPIRFVYDKPVVVSPKASEPDPYDKPTDS